VTPARCSQAAAARAVLPPYAARAAQPPPLPAAVNVLGSLGGHVPSGGVSSRP